VNAPTTTVAVPTWMRAELLDRCLESLRTAAAGASEILVVGRPEDEAARRVTEAAADFLPISWLTVDRPGHIAPIEVALEAATTGVLAVIDDDATAEPGWLDALVAPFAEPDVACVGGRVLNPGLPGRADPKAGKLRWNGAMVGNLGASEGVRRDVDVVMEGNWAWRADVLRRVGFDPHLDFGDGSMYGYDLCLGARAAGYRVVYEPRACVIHRQGPRDPALLRERHSAQVYTYSRNYTYAALKRLRGLRRGAFLAWFVFVGERGSYGVLKAAADLVLRRHGVIALARAAFAGKVAGVREWLSASSSRRAP